MSTATALYSQNSTQTGTTLAGAFPQTPGLTAQNLDLLQIVGAGGSVLLNVDYLGTVHNPASSATAGTRIGQFQTSLASGDTTAHYFANAFSNAAQNDILQVINAGGNIHYYLDYLGVAHGS
jgi:hypothetical protein